MATLKTIRGPIVARSAERFEIAAPDKLERQQVGLLIDSLVDQIEKLTGHPCLSGTHDLIIRSRFENVAQVRF